MASTIVNGSYVISFSEKEIDDMKRTKEIILPYDNKKKIKKPFNGFKGMKKIIRVYIREAGTDHIYRFRFNNYVNIDEDDAYVVKLVDFIKCYGEELNIIINAIHIDDEHKKEKSRVKAERKKEKKEKKKNEIIRIKNSLMKMSFAEIEFHRSHKSFPKISKTIYNEILDKKKKALSYKSIVDEEHHVELHNTDSKSSLRINGKKTMYNFFYGRTLAISDSIFRNLFDVAEIYYNDLYIADIQAYRSSNTIHMIRILEKRGGYSIVESQFPKNMYDEKKFVKVALDRIAKKEKVEKPLTTKEMEKQSLIKNRKIVLGNKYEDDFLMLFGEDKVVNKIQLIKSINNHATKYHDTIDGTVTLIYKNSKYKKYNTVTIVMRYCKHCRKYFDYYESFVSQLEKSNLKLSDLFVEIEDEQGKINNDSQIKYKYKSLLKICGYTVGVEHGLPRNERWNILDKVISSKLMTTTQIVNLLAYFIRHNGKKEHMEVAVANWYEDIEYINSRIKKGNIYNLNKGKKE